MTLISFAFGAGLLATVNPCGFAMLPAFLAYFLGDGADGKGARGVLAPLGHGFRVGLAVSAGFGGVFVAIGLLVAAGLRSLLPYVPWAAVVIGGALVLVGSAMVAGRHVGLAMGNRVRVGQGRDSNQGLFAVLGTVFAVVGLAAVGLQLRRRNVPHPGAGAAEACCADPNTHEAVSSGHVVPD